MEPEIAREVMWKLYGKTPEQILKALQLLEAVERLEKLDCTTLTLYKTFRGHIRGIYTEPLTGKTESDIETTFTDALIKLSEGLPKGEE